MERSTALRHKRRRSVHCVDVDETSSSDGDENFALCFSPENDDQRRRFCELVAIALRSSSDRFENVLHRKDTLDESDLESHPSLRSGSEDELLDLCGVDDSCSDKDQSERASQIVTGDLIDDSHEVADPSLLLKETRLRPRRPDQSSQYRRSNSDLIYRMEETANPASAKRKTPKKKVSPANKKTSRPIRRPAASIEDSPVSDEESESLSDSLKVSTNAEVMDDLRKLIYENFAKKVDDSWDECSSIITTDMDLLKYKDALERLNRSEAIVGRMFGQLEIQSDKSGSQGVAVVSRRIPGRRDSMERVGRYSKEEWETRSSSRMASEESKARDVQSPVTSKTDVKSLEDEDEMKSTKEKPKPKPRKTRRRALHAVSESSVEESPEIVTLGVEAFKASLGGREAVVVLTPLSESPEILSMLEDSRKREKETESDSTEILGDTLGCPELSTIEPGSPEVLISGRKSPTAPSEPLTCDPQPINHESSEILTSFPSRSPGISMERKKSGILTQQPQSPEVSKTKSDSLITQEETSTTPEITTNKSGTLSSVSSSPEVLTASEPQVEARPVNSDPLLESHFNSKVSTKVIPPVEAPRKTLWKSGPESRRLPEFSDSVASPRSPEIPTGASTSPEICTRRRMLSSLAESPESPEVLTQTSTGTIEVPLVRCDNQYDSDTSCCSTLTQDCPSRHVHDDHAQLSLSQDSLSAPSVSNGESVIDNSVFLPADIKCEILEEVSDSELQTLCLNQD